MPRAIGTRAIDAPSESHSATKQGAQTYPKGWVHIVWDNLNTHRAQSAWDEFNDRHDHRIVFHFTPILCRPTKRHGALSRFDAIATEPSRRRESVWSVSAAGSHATTGRPAEPVTLGPAATDQVQRTMASSRGAVDSPPPPCWPVPRWLRHCSDSR